MNDFPNQVGQYREQMPEVPCMRCGKPHTPRSGLMATPCDECLGRKTSPPERPAEKKVAFE